MSLNTNYSRILFKRSTKLGVAPTIPTGTTIDNTWLDTDILVGEGFINVADDKFWFRTDNGLVEVSLSGISSDNYYTTDAYLSGTTVYFDRNDLASAYSVDLNPILSGFSGDYLPLTITGTTFVSVNDNTLSFTGNASTEIYNYVAHDTDRITGNFVGPGGAYLLSIDSGDNDGFYVEASYADGANMRYGDGFGPINEFKINKGGMVASSTLTGFTGIQYGADYSANYGVRSLVDKGYVDGLAFSGVSGSFLALSGGTLTGPLIINSTLKVTGDTRVENLSATTVSILNSGATLQEYTDYSSNTIETGVTNSTIAAGSGNTVDSNRRNVFIAGVDIEAKTNDTAYFTNLNVNGDSVGMPYDLSFAISDETTAITSGTSKITIYAPRNFAITKVKASLSTSGSTTTTVDLNVGGSSILSAPLSLTANTFVNSTTSISTPLVTEDDRITVDIDAAGTGALGLKLYLIGKNR
jgi:hypothetical protein